MLLYEIKGLKEATFVSRPNRYLAEVICDGHLLKVHVHDPGRLRELLYEGNTCYIRYAASEKRKTDWDMIAAKKGDTAVLVHSGYQRPISDAILNSPELNPFGNIESLKAEVKTGDSRIDYKMTDEKGRALWVEVKGCSLAVDRVAKFPDAPTVRGTKHLKHLMALKAAGGRAGVLLLIFSDAERFEPNAQTDPEFTKHYYEAIACGVEVHTLVVRFEPERGGLVYYGPIPHKENH